jgi:hypothetical protein
VVARLRPARCLRLRLNWLLPLVLAAVAAGPPTNAAAVVQRHALFPRFERAVPVLLYHGLTASDHGYGVAPADFEAEAERLHALGFEAISLDQYVRFIRGQPVDLPQRPILITFDDAFRSSLLVADPVLSRYGWNATMYVPTGFVGLPGRLTWGQLRQMQASGRWQIDEHAGDGHVLVTVDAAGRRLPFYSSERWIDGGQETFAHYKLRVRRDIELGRSTLAREIPGWSSHGTFAVPFNNYGQSGSNDHRIEPWLRGYLESRFSAIFVQGGDAFTMTGRGFANRIDVPGGWTADTLEARLLEGARRLGPPAGPASR